MSKKIMFLALMFVLFVVILNSFCYAKEIEVVVRDGKIENIIISEEKKEKVTVNISDELMTLPNLNLQEMIQYLVIDKKNEYRYVVNDMLVDIFPFKVEKNYSYSIYYNQEENLIFYKKFVNETSFRANDIKNYLFPFIFLIISVYISALAGMTRSKGGLFSGFFVFGLTLIFVIALELVSLKIFANIYVLGYLFIILFLGWCSGVLVDLERVLFLIMEAFIIILGELIAITSVNLGILFPFVLIKLSAVNLFSLIILFFVLNFFEKRI